MKKYTQFFGLIGLVIFAYLLSTINLGFLIQSFRNINLYFFSISLLFIVPCVSTKTIKWLFLLEKEDRIPFRKAAFAWAAGFGSGLITPAKAGDFIRAKFLKTKFGKGLLTVLIDRINDVSMLFALGIISFFLLFSKTFQDTGYLFMLFFVIFLLGILVIRNKNIVEKIGKPFFEKLLPRKYKREVGTTFKHFYRNFEKIERKKVLSNLLLTILAWSLIFVQYWFLSLALDLGLNLVAIAMVTPVLLLVQLIPISVSGVGTREAAAVLLLGTFGVAPELAIAFSLGILIEDYLLGLAGLLYLVKGNYDNCNKL